MSRFAVRNAIEKRGPGRDHKRTIYALLDDSLITAFGFPPPSRLMRLAVGKTVRLRGFLVWPKKNLQRKVQFI
jgi:hypothetical protein